jgi:S1-C subfamily serine protease
VVGINAAIESGTGANSGVGFSIPVAAVRQIAPALIEDGSYSYPYMGASFDEEVSLADQALYDVPQTKGTYVMSVNPGGPAAQAGLIAADRTSGRGGDLIIGVDGQPVRNFQDLNRYLVFSAGVGKTIQLSVLRDGRETVVPLTLGTRP